MRLIGHSAGERYLAQWIACCQHEVLSELDASQNYIRVGRDTEPLAERTMETAGTDTREPRQRTDKERTGEVRIDVGHNTQLVHGQTVLTAPIENNRPPVHGAFNQMQCECSEPGASQDSESSGKPGK